MTDKEFQATLNKCAKIAVEHRKLIHKISDECIKRYGVEFAEVDADWIIDTLSYGMGGKTLTVEKFDEEMKDSIFLKGHKKDFEA